MEILLLSEKIILDQNFFICLTLGTVTALTIVGIISYLGINDLIGD